MHKHDEAVMARSQCAYYACRCCPTEPGNYGNLFGMINRKDRNGDCTLEAVGKLRKMSSVVQNWREARTDTGACRFVRLQQQ